MREMIGYIFGNLENIDAALASIQKSMSRMSKTNRTLLSLMIFNLGISMMQDKRIRKLETEMTNLRKKLDSIHTEFKE